MLMLLFLSFFTGSRSSAANDQDQILQAALNAQKLEAVLDKAADGSFLPLVLVTNNRVSDQLKLVYSGQQVKVYNNAAMAGKGGTAYLDVRSFRAGDGWAEVKMKYRKARITVKLTKTAAGWGLKSVYINNNGKRTYESNF